MSNEQFDVSIENLHELTRQFQAKSLYHCLQEVWASIIQETPVFNWHMEYLCDEIQDVLERAFRGEPKTHDLIINVPPGTSKSTIVSVVAPMWAWSRMPSMRTIVSTHAYDLGLDLSRKGREVFKNELKDTPGVTFAGLHGLELKKDLDSKGHFGNSKGGERYVATVGGKNPMGKHAHCLIIDDPIDPESAFSEVKRINANRFITNTLPSRMVDKTKVPIILLMQRLHQDDPTGHLVKAWTKSGTPYKHICIPAELTEDVQPRELRKFYSEDGLLDPIRLPRKVLDQIKGTSAYAYASQYLQTPIPLGGGMFNGDILRESITNEPAPKLKKIVRFWDKAASHEQGCYTAGVKMGIDFTGKFWILNVRRFQKATDARERAILATARLDGTAVEIGMEQEPGSAGIDSIQASIKNLAGWRVVPERPSGEKAVRAEPFATQVSAANVAMVEGEWNDDFITECEYFPNSTYKDQVDAAAGAFRMLVGNHTKIAKAI